MCKSFPKRILSITLSIVLLSTTIIYADNVVVGVAPSSMDKTQNLNASTTYLQNQYSGPGLLPNSSITYNTPIQGVSIDQSTGNVVSALSYSSNTADTGPRVTTITSPAAHNSSISSQRQNAQVITNGLVTDRVQTANTSDTGPTVYEISAPFADGEGINSNGVYGPGTVNYETSRNDVPQNPIPSYNTTTTNVYQNVDTGVIIYTTNDNIRAVKPNIVAPGALIVNATTRQIYYSKGGLNPFHPAALTNLVTAYILLSYKNLDDILVVNASAVTNLESGANTAKLRAGDTITVRDALGALFVKSCCDVANVIAENVSGSVPNFVALMNQTVRSWGCVGTNFTNPTGLNNNAQVTNTYDMAIIMDKATINPTIKLMLKQPAYVLPATTHRGALALTTSNKLLVPGDKNYYAGISASRLGYTSKAKYTMASELDYNGQKLIAIVLNANGSQFTDTTKLLNFGKVASVEASSGASYSAVLNNANIANASAVAAANFQAMQQAVAGQAAMQQAAAAQAANQAAMQQAAMQQAAMQQAAFSAQATNVFANQALANTAFASIADTQGIWQRDNKGWYFIKASGQSANNEWIKQNGKMYCVDSSGYMITGWRQMSNGNMYYFDPTSGELRHGTWVNVSSGAYYLQDDGTLAKAPVGQTKNITTSVGTYTIDQNGKAIAKVS